VSPAIRFLFALVLAVAVSSAALGLERGLGPESATAVPVASEVSGAWFCPHGGGEGWLAWVVLANPSDEQAEVRVATFRGGVRPSSARVALAPQSIAYVPVPADRPAAGSSAEFFGTQVAAGVVVNRAGEDLAAEPCAPTTGAEWHVASGTTVRGQDSRLVIVNPLRSDAVVDVELTTPEQRIRPGALTGIVIPPLRSAAVQVGEFVLGKGSVAATVRAALGQVAVAELGLADGSLRLLLGSTTPLLRWVMPAAGGSGTSLLSIFVPGDEEVVVGARAQSEEEQVTALDATEIEAAQSGAFEARDLEAGLFVEAAESTVGFIAARRLEVPGIGSASSGGVGKAATRWVALPPLGPRGGGMRLALQNPGRTEARVNVTLLGEGGPVAVPAELMEIAVPSGRTLTIDISDLVGEAPVAALVEATTGAVVVASVGRTDAAYSVSLAVPI
jgi:hypothetical protein